MMTTKRRLARKRHVCGSCDRCIEPGEVYLRHKSFPGYTDPAGYATAAGHPVTIAECARCACRYGRSFELGDIPYDQLCRQGLM